MNRTVFIAGSGTDAGKTFLTCALIAYARARNLPVHALKPVLSGYDPSAPQESDSGRIAAALGLSLSEASLARISPWRYAAPISPHLAARREMASLEDASLLDFCHAAMEEHPFLLIEGAGGTLSPLNETLVNITLAQHLRVPVLLCAGSYLGSISHSLGAIEATISRHIPLLGVAVIATHTGGEAFLYDTVEALRQFSPVCTPILPLPYQRGDASLSIELRNIAALVYDRQETE